MHADNNNNYTLINKVNVYPKQDNCMVHLPGPHAGARILPTPCAQAYSYLLCKYTAMTRTQTYTHRSDLCSKLSCWCQDEHVSSCHSARTVQQSLQDWQCKCRRLAAASDCTATDVTACKRQRDARSLRGGVVHTDRQHAAVLMCTSAKGVSVCLGSSNRIGKLHHKCVIYLCYLRYPLT